MSSRPNRRTASVSNLVFVLAAVLAGSSAGAADRWADLRGPAADGSAGDVRLFAADATGLAVGWKRALGSGYSGVVVGDGRVIAMFASGDTDVAAAFDAETGEELWRYRIADIYVGHDGSHDGPISTPALAGGTVFGLGPRGQLFALDAATGAPVWTTNVADDHGGKSPYYGFSTSPVVVDGVVVVEIGAGEGKAVAGFDAADGTLRWSVGDDEIHYHSPIATTLGGVRQIVAAGSKTVLGLDPATGTVLWTHEHGGDERAMGGATIVPVPAGEDRLFLMAKIDESQMVRVSRAGESWSVEPLWANGAIKQSYVIPAYHAGHLYGMNNRIFTCVDAATGEVRWRSREPGDGFPTVVGDHVVVVTKPGTLAVVAADPAEYREVARLELFSDQSWTSAAFADGKLFVRSMGELARVDPAAAAAADSGADWLAATEFGRFLDTLAGADDKSAAIDAYLAGRSVPIVEESGAVHFVYRGDVEDVGIVGDMIGFRREDPMHRVPGTDLFHWSTRLEPDAAVTYGFIPAYGEVVADPLNPAKASGLFGEVSWLAMPAWRVPADLDEAPADRRGRIETVEWDSAVREGKKRTARVWLPAGFDASSDRRYPVLYVHDGQKAIDEGSMTRTLDNLVGASVEPLIAVFVIPDADNPRADLGDVENYAKMVATELVPKIDATYPTRQDPLGRGSFGTGSAATAAMAVAFGNPDLFGRTAGMAPILMEGKEAEPFLSAAAGRAMIVYLDWGTYHLRSPHEAWDMGRGCRELWALMRERGWRPTGGERPVGVGWNVWRSYTGQMLSTVFPVR